ncbi:MAG: lasso peptide biosynthesis B2 protein [bacterium]
MDSTARMTLRSLLAVATSVRAAWSAPDTIERGLSALVEPPRSAATRASAGLPDQSRLASRVSHVAIGRFARLAPTRWRNTCLYRSVAECVALRALGLPARLVIGVGAPDTEVVAHAWVECDGVTCRATRGQAELETMSARGRPPTARTGAS